MRARESGQTGTRSSATPAHDPAGNIQLSGASEALRDLLIEKFGDEYSGSIDERKRPRNPSSPVRSDTPARRPPDPLRPCFHAPCFGGKAVDMLLEGQTTPSRYFSGA